MLTIYRRHLRNCEHRAEGRKYRRCRCPIWADGFLNGAEVRESLDLKDWEKAQQRIRESSLAAVCRRSSNWLAVVCRSLLTRK